uniref:AP2/ERF domain-containing protein n=1 Tax=Babesia bovis TaxID=5865 RepID=S6BKL7_BABBO|nr:conserved hypothetical protein [Babesia bovis]
MPTVVLPTATRLYTNSVLSRLIAYPYRRRHLCSLPSNNNELGIATTRPKLVHHVFRWGIGNAFRAQSKNRYRPTYAERNTPACIREDYFQCDAKFDLCKITYDTLNEQWEVLWTECGKLNGKPFPIKKFGIDASKQAALEFAAELDERLKTSGGNSLDYTSGPGLTFDHTLHCWVALGNVGRRRVARAYSADYHGFDAARRRAYRFAKRSTS